MKTHRITILLASLLATAAYSQTADSAASPSATASAPAVNAPMPAPNKVIYAPRLPTASELTAAAAAQQLAIVRIEQTAARVTVVYQSANGATSTVIYEMLPSAGGAATAVATPGSPPPAVVYQPAPRVVYYDGYSPGYYYGPAYYYDPFYWYPPVSLRFGFGYHGGYRGGFRR